MQLDVWCQTDKGLKRESNQDSFLMNKDLGLYIVADGMGGHSGGEVASAMAVKAVEKFIGQNITSGLSARELLVRAYEEASASIYQRAARENHLMGMGTTMVLCYINGSSIFVANVGDSRAYMYRKPHLWQITEDHSLMNEQLRAGMIKEEQLSSFLNKNVITRSVGYEKEVQVDVFERKLELGDCFLLCSDGLSGLVSDSKISEILNKTEGGKVPPSCIENALANGGDDNVTVMYLQTS